MATSHYLSRPHNIHNLSDKPFMPTLSISGHPSRDPGDEDDWEPWPELPEDDDYDELEILHGPLPKG